MGQNNQAYLVRGCYRTIDFILDGFFAAGAGFNPNSPYNTGTLIVPGRFVMGDFEVTAREGSLVLRSERLFIDRTPETIYRYEQQVRDGKVKVTETYELGNGDLRHIVEQATRKMLELRRGDAREKKIALELHVSPI